MVFDFAGQPALRWEGLPGLPADADYALAAETVQILALLANRLGVKIGCSLEDITAALRK